eukprot:358439-Chlamydomonas_euryale.AAC.3
MLLLHVIARPPPPKVLRRQSVFSALALPPVKTHGSPHPASTHSGNPCSNSPCKLENLNEHGDALPSVGAPRQCQLRHRQVLALGQLHVLGRCLHCARAVVPGHNGERGENRGKQGKVREEGSGTEAEESETAREWTAEEYTTARKWTAGVAAGEWGKGKGPKRQREEGGKQEMRQVEESGRGGSRGEEMHGRSGSRRAQFPCSGMVGKKGKGGKAHGRSRATALQGNAALSKCDVRHSFWAGQTSQRQAARPGTHLDRPHASGPSTRF